MQITAIWIPAHKSIQGNKEADQAVKEAARTGTKIPFKTPHTDLHAETAKTGDRLFRAYLEDAVKTKGNIYGCLYMKYNKKP